MVSDFLVGTGLALIFLFLSWLWGRATGAGKPLNLFKRRLLFYGFFFALGIVYIMVLVADLRWPRTLLFPAIACWGAILGFLAWFNYRRH